MEIQRLTPQEFTQFAKLIEVEAGIFLKEAKITLLSNRLRKRLRATGINTFTEYYHYISNPINSQELSEMINAVSTNETYFFRNLKHFDVLSNKIIPQMVEESRVPISILSAGCSTGEEAFTIAMILDKENQLHKSDVRIFANDINFNVLNEAKQGVFNLRKLRATPDKYKEKYFTTRDDENYYLDREIVSRVSFSQMNLLKDDFKTKFDIIFCRNVMIYFSKESQNILVTKLYNALKDGGYLFIGHSESLYFLDSKFNHKKVMDIPLYYKDTNIK